MLLQEQMSLPEKLNILSAAARYDVACTSSGVDRRGDGRGMGNCHISGVCHSFSADGRCISLLKILLTNECIFDCKYCMNRASNDVPRAAFTPEEICGLTMDFYKRNYIEGLFLSSGVYKSPNDTMELMYQAIYKLRREHQFQGYIHTKAIPGASPALIEKVGYLADRMSVNLELATGEGLKRLAPHKSRNTILKPMRLIQEGITSSRNELAIYRQGASFVPAGQSTQLIVGATPENDYEIVTVAEALYRKFGLKRVFYSAFVRVNDDSSLPALPTGPPLLREHRLYQADWLLRFYGFQAEEIVSERQPNFNVLFDPKCNWAISHLEYFPVEINRADYYTLLRVPGIGVKSARRIVRARRMAALDFPDIKKMGVVLKRALYFITCGGRTMYPIRMEEDYIIRNLLNVGERLSEDVGREYRERTSRVAAANGMDPRWTREEITYTQLSLFDMEGSKELGYSGKQEGRCPDRAVAGLGVTEKHISGSGSIDLAGGTGGLGIRERSVSGSGSMTLAGGTAGSGIRERSVSGYGSMVLTGRTAGLIPAEGNGGERGEESLCL